MEIELRAYLKSKEKTVKNLQEMGAKLQETERLIDYWLCKKEYNRFEQIAQDAVGSYGLRVRQQKKGKTTEYIEINCKVLEKQNDHQAFHEYCTEIADAKQALAIFRSIGFKVFCTINKVRTVYQLGNCLINLEDIKDFPPTIELEIIDSQNIDQHKKFLNDLMLGLGIEQQSVIQKSITYEYMKKYAFKQKNGKCL